MSQKESLVHLFTDCTYNMPDLKTKIEGSGILDIIRPDDFVLIKPNFVQESHELNDDWDYLITHPALISAVIELLTARLAPGRGRIVIADAPMTPARWDGLLAHLPVKHWKEVCAHREIPFFLIDLRDEEWHNASNGIILEAVGLSGDPGGKLLFNLKDDASEFFGKQNSAEGLYGADYDIKQTNDAHNGSDNLYSVSKTVMQADVVINMPKMKTHKKAGMTGALKNLVGINTNKNLLPHHTTGTPSQGGDQFSDSGVSRKIESGITYYAKKAAHQFRFLTPLLVPLKNLAIRFWGDNKQAVKSGAWWGNDTLWRTICDLNKLFYYGNDDGTLRADELRKRRRAIIIADGILAGEGNGPLAPDKVEAGWLLCGSNPVAVDYCAAWCMGLDWEKIPSIRKCFSIRRYPLAGFDPGEVICAVNEAAPVPVSQLPEHLSIPFAPPLGWIGHIELRRRDV